MARRLLLALTLAILLTGGVGFRFTGIGGPPAKIAAAATAAPTSAPPEAITIRDADLFIYVPASAIQAQPAQILVTMHGMGGDGPSFCQNLLAAAERNGWIIVSPTFKYQDYRNPELVLQDDLAFLPKLRAMLDTVPDRTGIQTRDKVLLYGFSRGGQAVHRFATLYPERTLAVAAVAAGSYTLPLQTMLVNGRSQTLAMPYGVANMRAKLGSDFNYTAFKQIPFRVSVGGNDTNFADTPRAWDTYLGTTRPERATAYTKTLQNLGVEASLAVYSGAGHQVTPQMLDDNLAFLQSIVVRNRFRFGAAPAIAANSYGTLIGATANSPR